MIRVLLADDHLFLRGQVAAILRLQRGIAVVGQCADGSEVVALASTVRPDLVLMDVRMPLMSGIAATRALLAIRPTTKVLILTGSMNRTVLEESRASGAVGFLLKDGDPVLLAQAVRTVAAGGSTWPLLF